MYKIVWLREHESLDDFKGKIIEVLNKQYLDYPECCWSIQCLVEVEKEEYE